VIKIQLKIKSFIENYVRNYKTEFNTITEWEKPLVGFANANNRLFLKLKEIVNYKHNLPQDILKNAETVISYFIPFRKETILSNREGMSSSKEWVIAYIETNQLIEDLNKFLAYELKQLAFDSVILPPTHNFDEKMLISDWSHKHIAYIAGLGNFGLHKLLITEKGCCGRLGSLVTSALIKASESAKTQFCLYFHDKSCRMCVEKCIFNALKVDFFDRHACYEICLDNGKRFSQYGFADVCGKCTSGVPCSIINPVAKINS
jgi:epoxyqueuosine reductase QueG